MSYLDSVIELNNLRILFSAIGLAGDLRDELLADADFAAVVARALLLPASARNRRGPPAAGIFPPFAKRPVPALEGKRIGIVASGGAGATASLIGVQRAFEESGLRPAAISACSGAALFGSLWAAGLTADEAARFWLELRDRDYLDPSWGRLLAAARRRFRGWAGLLDGAAVEHAFRQRLGDRTLGEAPIPFSAVVWNIDHNRVEYVGTRQTPDIRMARAARVAIALPPLLEPVRLGEHLYGDGGIVDIFPAAPLLELDPPLDAVFGVNCYYGDGFLGEDASGFRDQRWAVVRASAQLRWAGHLELARERMRSLGDRLTLLHPVPYEETRGARFYRDFLDRSSWPRAMRQGYDTARAALDRFAERRPRATPVPALRPEPMAPVDAAWTRLETADNPLTITSVLFFDEPIDHARLLEAAGAAVQAQPRLRERVDEHGCWSPVASVDLGQHVLRSTMPEALAGPALDRARPLWRVDHVEGYRGGSALVARVHHAIGDGPALVRLLLSVADPGAAPFSTAAVGPVLRPEDLTRHKSRVAGTLADLLTRPDDPATSLRAPLGGDKRFAWSDPLPLARLQAIADASDATPGDVVLAALSGALRRLLHERGERTGELTLRAIVPVNLREGERDLGNRFGLIFAPLPLGVEEPGERLGRIALATAGTRRSPEAALSLLTLAGLGKLPPELAQRAARLFTRKASLVVTSVRGPQDPISFAGKPISSMVFFAPAAAELGLAASILCYAGQFRLGIAADTQVCAAPASLVAAFVADLDVLGRIGPARTVERAA